MNHFEVFGLAPSATIDVKALEQRHRELSLEHHPDRLAQADARTRRQALEQTTALNEALKVLKDPARRAAYLLKLKGVDLEKDAPAVDPSFLGEMMERRELLEQVLAAKDTVKARAMADEVARQRDGALAKALDALGRDSVREAAHELGRLRYYARFVEDVEAFEEAEPPLPVGRGSG